MATENAPRSRSWQVTAFALAVLAVDSGGIAVGTLLVALTDANAGTVRTVLFGIVPALSLVAVAALAAAIGRSSGRVWLAMVLGLCGIGFAAMGHQLWYQGLDAEQSDSTAPAVLLGAAVLFCAAAIITIALPALRRSRLSTPAAVSLSVVAGVVGGAAFVLAIATPFASFFLAIGALITVLVTTRTTRSPRTPLAHVAH